MGGYGCAAAHDRAFQARYLCPGHRRFWRLDAKIVSAKKKAPARKKGKPPVVMIHGAFVGPWSLDGFAKKFRAAGYEVHAPCLRHHDKAKPPPDLGQTSLTDYAADLENLLD